MSAALGPLIERHTQVGVGKLLGYDQSYVGRVWHGALRPGVNFVDALAAVLEVSRDELLGRRGPVPPTPRQAPQVSREELARVVAEAAEAAIEKALARRGLDEPSAKRRSTIRTKKGA